MKTKTIAAAAGLLVLAGILFGPVRRDMEDRRPDLVKGYRGIIMELPKNQLAWVKKGDSIDVISVFDAIMSKGSDPKKQKVSTTLLQNVKVAGVNAHKGTIVLLVNPVEAEYVPLGKEQGSISIALRAKGDAEMVQLEIASYRKLIR